MAPPVSLELRERIIAWRYELHMSISDIMRLSSRCEKTVHNILKSFRENDNLFGHPVIERRGRKRLLDRDDLNYLESILRAEPGLFLDEVQEKLRIVRDVEVSITTISRTLNRLAITHKHIAKEAAERNEHQQDGIAHNEATCHRKYHSRTWHMRYWNHFGEPSPHRQVQRQEHSLCRYAGPRWHA